MKSDILELVYFKDYEKKYSDLATNKEEWITIFEVIKTEEDGFNNDIFSFSALQENNEENLKKIMEDYQWGFTPDSFGKSTFTKYGISENEQIVFETGELHDNFEYIVAYRIFDADFPPQIEINPKLIWYYNLVKVENGYIEPLTKDYKIKVEKEKILVLKDYLRDFLAAYNKICIIGFDNRRFFNEDLKSEKTHKTNNKDYFHYSLTVEKHTFSDYNYYSCILGKVIIRPFLEPNHPYYTYFKPEEEIYEEFIVGVDEDTGKQVLFTCNEDKLANFFGSNPDAPHFLTPVYFKKEVLDRYTNNPAEFSVEDDHITYLNQWLIPYNINKEDKVSVWIGDLGRIPHNEQLYWKAFNIKPQGVMNEKFLRRQLGAEFTDAIRDEKRLLHLIDSVDEIFFKKYNKTLFNNLSEADLQIKNAFSIPTNNSTTTYQNFLMQLCKLTVERINTKLVEQLVEDKSKLKDKKGERYGSRIQLKVLLDELDLSSSQVLDEILKRIYNSRNKLAGHIGSYKEYNKVWSREAEYKPDFILDAKFLLENLNKALTTFEEESKEKFGVKNAN